MVFLQVPQHSSLLSNMLMMVNISCMNIKLWTVLDKILFTELKYIQRCSREKFSKSMKKFCSLFYFSDFCPSDHFIRENHIERLRKAFYNWHQSISHRILHQKYLLKWTHSTTNRLICCASCSKRPLAEKITNLLKINQTSPISNIFKK